MSRTASTHKWFYAEFAAKVCKLEILICGTV